MSRPARTDNELDKDRLSMLLIKAQDGMTYNEFAEKCEVSSSYLCKCIKKQINSAPSKKILAKIAAYTKYKGVTEDDLLEAAGYSLKKSSRDYTDHLRRRRKLSTATIMASLIESGLIWKISTVKEDFSDFCIDVEADIFKQWYFKLLFKDNESPLDDRQKEVLSYCVNLLAIQNGTEDLKYSFVTTSTALYEELKNVQLPLLHMLVSVILINTDTLDVISEDYIETHIKIPKATKNKYILTKTEMG